MIELRSGTKIEEAVWGSQEVMSGRWRKSVSCGIAIWFAQTSTVASLNAGTITGATNHPFSIFGTCRVFGSDLTIYAGFTQDNLI